MRLNINLASQPYEDIRRFSTRWGIVLAVLVLVTAGLCYYAVHSWRESRDVNAQIEKLRGEIRALDQEKQAGIALLNRSDNKATADESKFLNQLIARKAFSWTRVFMDLERLMPPGLHVVSIKPELNKRNQLEVRMQVGGSSRERAIELVRRMEESATFKQARVDSENVAAQSAVNTDPIQFEITSMYVPLSVAAGQRVEPASEQQGKPAPTGARAPAERPTGGVQ